MAHLDAVGYRLSENPSTGSCGNPSGGTASAPVKNDSTMGRVMAPIVCLERSNKSTCMS